MSFGEWLVPLRFWVQKELSSVGVTDFEACLRWALGDRYATAPKNMWDELWNERHSDLFVLYGYDLVGKSIQRMGTAYLAQKGK